MTLGELIAFLETVEPDAVVKDGFWNPHSHRGHYYDLAFEPCERQRVGALLACARRANGSCYEGYKGGEFLMDLNTTVHLAKWGKVGEPMTISHLRGIERQAKASTHKPLRAK